MAETNGSTQAKRFTPELFRYEAFNGAAPGGLATVLHALAKLSRLSKLAQRGLHAEDEDILVGDADLIAELATAVECAALHARAIHEEGGA